MGSPSAAMPVLSFGDFYSDGNTDIAVSIAGDVVVGEEIIFLGNGDGNFQAAKASAGVFYVAFAVVGDFNRDGKLDVAISRPGFCNGTCSVQPSVFVLLGTGDGTFQALTAAFTVNGPTGSKGTLASADVNGDGNADLLWTTRPAFGSIWETAMAPLKCRQLFCFAVEHRTRFHCNCGF
jgi:hypothetical protein